ncbi:hypothetical protein M8C13_07480 [Crossiella sp. SN42]|uniref:hypothetical protein n=1 Tax=Crossiella sp. SN42 TaxID=2944808 RepID=UPI00207C657E|nr:hypothetical protein [Crossiella sp. SN42]MCO1575598.1 hypothetical protein [Crossiella sp. SN42]
MDDLLPDYHEIHDAVHSNGDLRRDQLYHLLYRTYPARLVQVTQHALAISDQAAEIEVQHIYSGDPAQRYKVAAIVGRDGDIVPFGTASEEADPAAVEKLRESVNALHVGGLITDVATLGWIPRGGGRFRIELLTPLGLQAVELFIEQLRAAVGAVHELDTKCSDACERDSAVHYARCLAWFGLSLRCYPAERQHGPCAEPVAAHVPFIDIADHTWPAAQPEDCSASPDDVTPQAAGAVWVCNGCGLDRT